MGLEGIYNNNPMASMGALGGFQMGQDRAYNTALMDDAKKKRDLELMIQQHGYDQSLLDDPVKAMGREVAINKAPLDIAKTNDELTDIQSGRPKRDRDVGTDTKEFALKKAKQAQEIIDDGDWLLEATELARNPMLMGTGAWDEHMKKKPTKIKFPDASDQPTPLNTEYLRSKAERFVVDKPMLQKMALASDEAYFRDLAATKRQEFDSKERALDRSSKEAVAASRPGPATKPETSLGLRKRVGEAVASGDAEAFTLGDLAAYETEIVSKLKPTDAEKINSLMSTMRKNKKDMSDQEQRILQQRIQRMMYPRGALEIIEEGERLKGKPPLSPLTEQEVKAAESGKAVPTTKSSGYVEDALTPTKADGTPWKEGTIATKGKEKHIFKNGAWVKQ